MQHEPPPRGFFGISRFRLWSTIGLLALCVAAINPWTYATQVSGTALINWLLVGIMFVSLAILLVDLAITRRDEPSRTEGIRHD